MRCRNDSAQRWPGGSRAGAGQATALSLHPNQAESVASRGRLPFDREMSLALDTQQAALDEIAEGFGHLRVAYQISPADRYLPKALLATVEAFGEAVGAVRELESAAGL